MSERDENQEGEVQDEKDELKNLTEEMHQEIEEVFDIFDKDKDQLITYYDLTMLLRWLKFNPTEAEMKAYAKEYDQVKSNYVRINVVKKIVNKKMAEPDTIEELIEAMKLFDYNNDGTIPVNELRWAMTKIGDPLDETAVDDMLKELDSDNKGYIEILEFAKTSFNIKEKKSKD